MKKIIVCLIILVFVIGFEVFAADATCPCPPCTSSAPTVAQSGIISQEDLGLYEGDPASAAPAPPSSAPNGITTPIYHGSSGYFSRDGNNIYKYSNGQWVLTQTISNPQQETAWSNIKTSSSLYNVGGAVLVNGDYPQNVPYSSGGQTLTAERTTYTYNDAPVYSVKMGSAGNVVYYDTDGNLLAKNADGTFTKSSGGATSPALSNAILAGSNYIPALGEEPTANTPATTYVSEQDTPTTIRTQLGATANQPLQVMKNGQWVTATDADLVSGAQVRVAPALMGPPAPVGLGTGAQPAPAAVPTLPTGYTHSGQSTTSGHELLKASDGTYVDAVTGDKYVMNNGVLTATNTRDNAIVTYAQTVAAATTTPGANGATIPFSLFNNAAATAGLQNPLQQKGAAGAVEKITNNNFMAKSDETIYGKPVPGCGDNTPSCRTGGLSGRYGSTTTFNDYTYNHNYGGGYSLTSGGNTYNVYIGKDGRVTVTSATVDDHGNTIETPLDANQIPTDVQGFTVDYLSGMTGQKIDPNTQDPATIKKMTDSMKAFGNNVKNVWFMQNAKKSAYYYMSQFGQKIQAEDLAFANYLMDDKWGWEWSSGMLTDFAKDHQWDGLLLAKTKGVGYGICYSWFKPWDWDIGKYTKRARQPVVFQQYIIHSGQNVTPEGFGHAQWDFRLIEYNLTSEVFIPTNEKYYRYEGVLLRYDADINFTIKFYCGDSQTLCFNLNKVLNSSIPAYQKSELFHVNETKYFITKACLSVKDRSTIFGLEELPDNYCIEPTLFSYVGAMPTTAGGGVAGTPSASITADCSGIFGDAC